MPAVPDVRSAPDLPWWSEVWRLVAACVIGLGFCIIQAAETSSKSTVDSDHVVALVMLDVVIGLACVVLTLWRRRFPRAVAVVTGLAGAVSVMSTGPWLLSAVSLSTRRRPLDILLLAFTALAAGFGFEALVSSPTPIPAWMTLVVSWLIVLVCSANGWYIGARRDLVASLQSRAETAEREQSARVAEARARERTAIAREMHDILAHRISLVAMHAGALTYRTDLTREQSAETAQIIEANAHLALSDLRDVLGVLRSGAASAESASAARRPQPSWSDLPVLLQDARQAGMQIVETDSTAARPPVTIARHAYRVVQESLTNVRKHAPGGVTRLDLAGEPGADLVVTVSNPVPGLSTTHVALLPGAGLGLAGLAERAELAGGTLTHGPTGHGSFEVRATFPWPLDPAVPPPPAPPAPAADASTNDFPLAAAGSEPPDAAGGDASRLVTAAGSSTDPTPGSEPAR